MPPINVELLLIALKGVTTDFVIDEVSLLFMTGVNVKIRYWLVRIGVLISCVGVYNNYRN